MLVFSSFYNMYCTLFEKNKLSRFCTIAYAEPFYQFTRLLMEENSHTNLTAIREFPDIIAKHYADCLLAEKFFPQNATVIDVGCGGGFPAIPLAIVRPDLRITAVDSTLKKINFVEKATKFLNLNNVTPLCARAESEEMQVYRQKFDIATSRAMARMSVLTELTLPFLKIDGQLIALKGAQGAAELEEARNAIKILGGADTSDNEFTLYTETGEESRHILVVQKKSDTPKQYPRHYSTITKKPL